MNEHEDGKHYCDGRPANPLERERGGGKDQKLEHESREARDLYEAGPSAARVIGEGVACLGNERRA